MFISSSSCSKKESISVHSLARRSSICTSFSVHSRSVLREKGELR
jgi:hypothetical protein